MISMIFMPWDWGEPLPVSSVHGSELWDVLDAIIENLPNETEEENPVYH